MKQEIDFYSELQKHIEQFCNSFDIPKTDYTIEVDKKENKLILTFTK